MRRALALILLGQLSCSEPVVLKSYLTLVNISPSSGAGSVSVDTQIIATFSEDLDGDTVDAQTAYLEDATSLPVVASVLYDADTRSILVSPEAPLSEDTEYTVVFTRDIAGTESGPLGSVIMSDFRTAGGALQNELPLADAGEDQPGQAGTRVELDGAASADPEGERLTYSWRIVAAPEGSESTLTKEDAVRTAFTPDMPGAYAVGLTVNDGIEDSSEDFVVVQASSSSGGTDDTGGADSGDTGG
jgi:hypothetical protein